MGANCYSFKGDKQLPGIIVIQYIIEIKLMLNIKIVHCMYNLINRTQMLFFSRRLIAKLTE